MKLTWLRGVLVIMGILAALGGLFGCNRGGITDGDDNGERGSDGIGESAQDNTSGIVRFRYSYDGTIGGNNYSYEVTVKDGAATLTYEAMEFRDYGEMTCALPADFMAKLEAIYRECRLAAWDGYSKYNEWVCDGDGFSLSIRFADGASMSASGSNCYPPGYGAFAARIGELFAPYVQTLLEEGRQAKIGEGIHGELTSIMVTIIGRGDFGNDEYHVLIYREGVRDRNFDVRVTSRSGEFLPKGEYKVWRAVPNDLLDFAAVQAMIEEYGLIGWYNWDKAAEDPGDAEWFQVSFGFESTDEGEDGGSSFQALNAMGTAHPEGYDEFRAAFLTWLAAKVLEVQALPE